MSGRSAGQWFKFNQLRSLTTTAICSCKPMMLIINYISDHVKQEIIQQINESLINVPVEA